MPKIISIHSFRGGTGKSNTTANLTAVMASQGMRVGVVDTDIQSPGIHILFGLNDTQKVYSLNDYLWGKCSIKQAAHDVTANLGVPIKGKVFLIPSSIKIGEISRVLREGYDPGVLNDGYRQIIADLKLDVLMIDTHPGLNEETLLSIAMSDVLGVIMRPDQQDYQGTSVTVEVARKLNVARLVLIVNKVPAVFNAADVKARVEKAYNCEVAAILPHSDEMMALASAGILYLRYPNLPMSSLYVQIVKKMLA